MIWSNKQIKFLKDNYSIRGKKWCVKKLMLNENQVRYMASKLRLKIDLNSKLLNYDNKGKGHFKGKKRPDHSIKMKEAVKNGKLPNFLKRPTETIIKKCIICNKKMKFKVPEKSLLNYKLKNTCSNKCFKLLISKNTSNYQKINGHPKGMKGKHHTVKTKKAMSERWLKMWRDKNSWLNSEENKQRVSDMNIKLHKLGVLGGNNAYSNCKRGWFYYKDKKYFMRSGWEIRYAAYLVRLMHWKIIKDWEYEVDTFWFKSIKRGVRSYKPDFKIYNLDGSIEYHEVKGIMDSKSKTKIKRMALYYPNVKLKIMDATYFKLNKNNIPSYNYAINKYSSVKDEQVEEK